MDRRDLALSLPPSRARLYTPLLRTAMRPLHSRPSLEWFRFRSPCRRRAPPPGYDFQTLKGCRREVLWGSCKLFYGIRGSVSLSVRDTIETDTRPLPFGRRGCPSEVITMIPIGSCRAFHVSKRVFSFFFFFGKKSERNF